jgi:hypothetical protein
MSYKNSFVHHTRTALYKNTFTDLFEMVLTICTSLEILRITTQQSSCKVPKDNAKLILKCKYCLRDFAGLQLHLKRNSICRLKNEEWSTNLGK